ncbi:hypothetical protein N7517_011170 [Penicillium concentricum]|uniref:Uncharacterized protein n=1 Tax=Penicillium concentricum TaxID=293559 RepID=A0A9W9UVS3_9EURO|nr:uncharacterized protein N7517_011170 [Penicillium concentricum]KAJ5356561.1 hypothetical protein N7517_011170 [Penicillium concentricum]
MADGVRDDLEVSPRPDCKLLDRHVAFLEEHYHLPLDVAIESSVDVFYSRTPADGFYQKSYKGGLASSCFWNPSSSASSFTLLDLSIVL